MLQIALAIWGIVVLFTGKLTVSKTKVVQGTAARLLGLLMLMPFPVAFMIGVAVGAWGAASGRDLEDLQMTLMAVDAGLVIGTAVLVLAIAHAIGKSPVQDPLTPAFPPGQYAPPYPSPAPPADPNNPYHSPRF